MFVQTLILLGFAMIIVFTFMANGYNASRATIEEGIAVLKFTERKQSERQGKIVDQDDSQLVINGGV